MVKRVSGGSRLQARIRELRDAAPRFIQDELTRSSETVRTNVVADIRTVKVAAGVTMRGGPGRRKHIPSPPWGPPNSDTGNLAARYTTAIERLGRTFRAFVVAGVRYAKFLEWGTVKMLPRPHLLPRFRQEVTKLRERLKRQFK